MPVAGRLLSRRQRTAAGVGDGWRESADGYAATERRTTSQCRAGDGDGARGAGEAEGQGERLNSPLETQRLNSRRLTARPLATRRSIDLLLQLTRLVVIPRKFLPNFALPSRFILIPRSKISTETSGDLARVCPPCVMVLQD